MPPTRRHWINAWTRWPTRSVTTIRVPMRSDALPRSGRWPAWKPSYGACAGYRSARPPRSAPPPMPRSFMCWPSRPPSDGTSNNPGYLPGHGILPAHSSAGVWWARPNSSQCAYPPRRLQSQPTETAETDEPSDLENSATPPCTDRTARTTEPAEMPEPSDAGTPSEITVPTETTDRAHPAMRASPGTARRRGSPNSSSGAI